MLLSFITIFTTGCQDSQSEQLIEQLTTDNETTAKFCSRQTSPFKYSLCQVEQTHILSGDALSLRLFWKPDDDNKNQTLSPLYKFESLIANLPQKSTLEFAANAGMYNSEFAPIGYTVIKGEEIRSLNLKEGGGNFHLLPNGVLWWDKNGKVNITESQQMNDLLKTDKATPWYATQSGPMLVIDGNIHPKFNPDSTSLKFRNGVGVCADGQIKFVNSDEPVNFYQFAALFKGDLSCHNALFLDGGVASALYAPEIGQKDEKNMGVMVGVVETAEAQK